MRPDSSETLTLMKISSPSPIGTERPSERAEGRGEQEARWRVAADEHAQASRRPQASASGQELIHFPLELAKGRTRPHLVPLCSTTDVAILGLLDEDKIQDADDASVDESL